MDILKKNFFELFDVDVAVDLNKFELDQTAKLLQSQFHPDKYINSTDFEKRLALQISSHINDGHKTLGDIVSRVEYILKINNFNKDESKTINDINFLQEQIEYSELIEEMKNSPDNALIEKSLLDVNKLLKQIIAKIKKSLNNSDFEEMWINFSKLRFYMNNVNELLEIKKI
ncbi:MAG: molecular chaperone HscB [Gammaproteobacteria bacterium]|jgi:molecular chaperone HscB|tara:strand:- start:2337 stop:2852 length:516 start_codon:yes stop_codon:yes gene_type:complete